MLTRPERLALLLNILGDEAAELAKSGMNGDALAELESALRDFDEYPPSEEEVQLVLDDFENYFALALESTENSKDGDEEGADEFDGPRILEIPEENFDVELQPTRKFEAPALTGNVEHDLNLLHPYQVAEVLKQESSTVAALVICKLANSHAAKTLEFLPAEMRPPIFLHLSKPIAVSERIHQHVLETTRELALKVEERRSEEEASDKMANLVRSMPKPLRAPMMEELANSDKNLADAVKKKLYRFDDLRKLSDRDMQQLLANCRTETLVLALQKVEEDLLNRVLGNMSKRAKQALQEEIEFASNAKQVEIDDGRLAVVQVLAELDDAGTITVE